VAANRRHRGKRRAKLTLLEDHCWVFALCYYLDEGKTDAEADRLAWRDTLSQFPRLRFYDGCEP
jgi:hypothetical protein